MAATQPTQDSSTVKRTSFGNLIPEQQAGTPDSDLVGYVKPDKTGTFDYTPHSAKDNTHRLVFTTAREGVPFARAKFKLAEPDDQPASIRYLLSLTSYSASMTSSSFRSPASFGSPAPAALPAAARSCCLAISS